MRNKEIVKVCIDAVFEPHFDSLKELHVYEATMTSLLSEVYYFETGAKSLLNGRDAFDSLRDQVSEAASTSESLLSFLDSEIDKYREANQVADEVCLSDMSVGSLIRFCNSQFVKAMREENNESAKEWAKMSDDLEFALETYLKAKGKK